MIDYDFARNVDPNEYLMDFINKTPSLSSTDADIVLYDLYDINYGIFDHRNAGKTKPLSSVAMHECENNTADSNLYKVIDAYHSRGVKEVFGLSLLEFLNLPGDLCIYVIEVCSKDSAVKNKIFDGLNNVTKK